MKQTIWLTYDLGVRGDYQGLYQYLDSHQAKECGDRVAVFTFEYEGDLVSQLRDELKKVVEVNRFSRVYVIYHREDGKPRGRFIIGKRKAPPWTGFGVGVEEEDVGE